MIIFLIFIFIEKKFNKDNHIIFNTGLGTSYKILTKLIEKYLNKNKN